MRLFYLLIDFINSLSPIVTFFLGMISVAKDWVKDIEKRMIIRKLLTLKQRDTITIIPVRYGTLSSLQENTIIEMRVQYSYVTYMEAQVLLLLPQLAALSGNHRRINLRMPGDQQTDLWRHNVFLFGAPGSNQYVKSVLRGNYGFRFKAQIVFGCTEESYNHPSNEHWKDLRKPCGKQLLYGKLDHSVEELTPYLYYDDYLVLIKIAGTDFAQKGHGTVHICFGHSDKSALYALICYLEHYSHLYAKLKEKKHYFCIMRCNQVGEIDFSDDSFLDLTNCMF